MSNKPRVVRISWDCPCGQSDVVAFDLAARPHSRTRQCPGCGQINEVRSPIILDLGIHTPLAKSPPFATGESPKGDPR